MRLGRTIVAEREKTESESERMQARHKQKVRKYVTIGVVLMALVVVAVAISVVLPEMLKTEEVEEVVREEFAPTVAIEDASGADLVTARVREYVGMAEADFKEKGLTVVRVVLPAGKTREVDFYLEGRGEYYKFNLDRGTGVSVEDAERIVRYLNENGVSGIEYVDVRVPRKAYYK